MRSGDTLHSIAWRYGQSVEDLVAWNDLDSPDRIYPGQDIRLRPGPGDAPATAATDGGQGDAASGGSASGGAASSGEGASGNAGQSTSADRDGASGGDAEEGGDGGDGSVAEWAWPTAGEVVGTFGDGRAFGRGIDITGEAGQPVRAAAGGEVVYSGEGLEAYGPLIIIRHNSAFLSAYAHNTDVRVAEGDRVERGDRIASMGRSLDDEPLLHFEIRRDGDPVDPLDYLGDRP